MPVVRDTAFPLANYPTGTHSMPSSLVPDWVIGLGFEMARCTSAAPTVWPSPLTTLSVALEVSRDSGATWRPLGGFTAAGGIITDKSGAEVDLTQFAISLPEGTGRRLRGTVTIAGGPLRSAGTLEVRD